MARRRMNWMPVLAIGGAVLLWNFLRTKNQMTARMRMRGPVQGKQDFLDISYRDYPLSMMETGVRGHAVEEMIEYYPEIWGSAEQQTELITVD